MRVLAYTDSTVRGGAERALATLLADLDPRIEVTVLGVDRSVASWVAEGRPNTPVRLVPPVRSKRDLRRIAAHFRAVRALRPHILHANLWSPWSGQYGIAAGLLTPGVRVVCVEHAAIPSTDAVQRRLRRVLMNGVAAHVSVSDSAARQVEEFVGLRPGAVRTIYNGVPDAPPRPLSRVAQGPVVGTLTRVDPHKGLDILLEALTELPGVTGVIVGEGPELSALRALATRLGVGDRLLTPGFSDSARDYLTGFDVYVLPSRFEALPISIVEAMLAGLPVVASDVGGVPEVVEPEATGLLVAPGDPGALAAALRRLLENADLRRRMGERGRAIAGERFSSARMARAYERLYAEVMD